MRDADLLPDLSVRAKWAQAPRGADTTPGDPMDRPASDEWLRAQIGTQTVPLTVGTTEAVLPPRPRPFAIRLSAGNEWGTQYHRVEEPTARSVLVGTMTGKFLVPAQATFSGDLKIDSSLDEYLCACAEQPDSGIPMWLQARPTASAAWTTVGRFSGDTVDPLPDLDHLGRRAPVPPVGAGPEARFGELVTGR